MQFLKIIDEKKYEGLAFSYCTLGWGGLPISGWAKQMMWINKKEGVGCKKWKLLASSSQEATLSFIPRGHIKMGKERPTGALAAHWVKLYNSGDINWN